MSDASVDPSVFLDNSEQVTSVFFATIHYRITQYRMGIMTLGFCRYQSSQVGSRQGFGLFMMSMQINLRQTSVSQSVGMDHTLENICFSPSERIWTTGLQRMPDFWIILKLNLIFWHWLMKGKWKLKSSTESFKKNQANVIMTLFQDSLTNCFVYSDIFLFNICYIKLQQLQFLITVDENEEKSSYLLKLVMIWGS